MHEIQDFSKAIVDSFEMLLDAFLFQIVGLKIFLFWSFPVSVAISVAMRSFLLNYVIWN